MHPDELLANAIEALQLARLGVQESSLSAVSSVADEAMRLAELVAQAPPIIPTEYAQRGTWTPTDASGAGLALTIDSAIWFRQKNLIIARAAVTYPATASGANAAIGGLPFTVAGFGSANQQGFISYSDIGTVRFMIPAQGTRNVLFFNPGAFVTNAQVSTATFYFTAIYETPP
jgi:hypothetical protein